MWISLRVRIHHSASHKLLSQCHAVVKTPAEAAGHYDYVVCCQKAVEQEAVVKLLAPVMDENTTIVLLQNGVEIEEPFRAMHPKNTILTCCVGHLP